MSIEKIEYRVVPVTRYVVTRYEQTADGGSVGERGEYGNNEIGFEVAYALCRAEHEALGWPVGDERIQYPRRVEGHRPVQMDDPFAPQG